jgi:hypothetical protein
MEAIMNATHLTTNAPIQSEEVFKQLIGTSEGWDQADDWNFVFHKCSKFNGASCNVSLESGTVEVLNEDGTGVQDTFFIKCELIAVELVKEENPVTSYNQN